MEARELRDQLNKHLEDTIERYRTILETDRSDTETSKYRGAIKECRNLLKHLAQMKL